MPASQVESAASPRNRIFEQMPTRAVAELLGLTTNAVDLRLNRAKAKLRALLGEQEQEHT